MEYRFSPKFDAFWRTYIFIRNMKQIEAADRKLYSHTCVCVCFVHLYIFQLRGRCQKKISSWGLKFGGCVDPYEVTSHKNFWTSEDSGYRAVPPQKSKKRDLCRLFPGFPHYRFWWDLECEWGRCLSSIVSDWILKRDVQFFDINAFLRYTTRKPLKTA